MHEMQVSGEIKTVAARQGSSGIFAGDIQGLYQGYRFGSTTPDEQEYTIDVPDGSITLLLRQQIVTPLPPRPDTNPFADGKDPFDNPIQYLLDTFGGPPPGVPGGEEPGMEGGKEIFKRVHYMETKFHVVPEKCTGIFAGSTGEMDMIAPNYKMRGYLIVETDRGDLKMDFLEAGSRETLNADLWVNGEDSTGIWKGAEGELTFALEVTPPFFGRGPYSGTIRLQQAPS
ncbi:MAG: hypothetical protein ACXVKA_14525 [Acidimicrobiia bacterium]